MHRLPPHERVYGSAVELSESLELNSPNAPLTLLHRDNRRTRNLNLFGGVRLRNIRAFSGESQALPDLLSRWLFGFRHRTCVAHAAMKERCPSDRTNCLHSSSCCSSKRSSLTRASALVRLRDLPSWKADNSIVPCPAGDDLIAAK